MLTRLFFSPYKDIVVLELSPQGSRPLLTHLPVPPMVKCGPSQGTGRAMCSLPWASHATGRQAEVEKPEAQAPGPHWQGPQVAGPVSA